MSSPVLPILLVANYFVALILLCGLWRKETGAITKCLWSVVLLVPFAGPIFYAGFFNPAPPMPPHRRAGVNPHVAPNGNEVIDAGHGVAQASTRQQRKRKRRDAKRETS